MKPFTFTGDQLAQGAVDFRFLLDAPAGKHGLMKVQDGRFVFEDGRPIRFFGVNLVFGAAMPEREYAVLIAERLARSGINMVRFHHVDSYQTGENTATLIDYSGGDSQKVHPENFDRLDYLVSELKARGIYLHIDLFTLRAYLPGDDLEHEGELKGALKHANYYNRRLIDLHKKFIHQYLTHLNPYTGLRYVDEPAVAVVQLLNENGIFWENGDLDLTLYKSELDTKWNAWLLSRYKNRAGLDGAWTKDDGSKALKAEEDPALGTVARPPIGIWDERRIPWQKAYDDEEGPARFADHTAFLIEVETAYIDEMKAYLREIGVKCAIDASNLPSGAAELKCVSRGDVTENNCYWNHPMGGFPVPVTFHEKIMVETDPRDRNAVAGFTQNMITRLAFARVAGKPFVVTEWDVCYPTKFRSDVMLMLSSYAALQRWDGLLLFSYSHFSGAQLKESQKMSGFFNSYNDPAVWGLAGIASAIFQMPLVKEAERLVELGYSSTDCLATPPGCFVPYGTVPFISRIQATFLEDDVYQGAADAVLSSGFTATGDYTGARHSLVYARSPYADPHQKVNGLEGFLGKHAPGAEAPPLTDASGGVLGVVDSKRAILYDGNGVDQDSEAFTAAFDQSMKAWGLLSEQTGCVEPGIFVSDTGELKFHFKEGFFALAGEKAAAFAGRIGSEAAFGPYVLKAENARMAVTVLSRDDKELEASGHLLIAAVGESQNAGMVWEGRTLVDEGTGPIEIDPLKGQLLIPSRYRVCRAYVLDPTGARVAELPVQRSEEGFVLSFDGSASIYFEVLLSDIYP